MCIEKSTKGASNLRPKLESKFKKSPIFWPFIPEFFFLQNLTIKISIFLQFMSQRNQPWIGHPCSTIQQLRLVSMLIFRSNYKITRNRAYLHNIQCLKSSKSHCLYFWFKDLWYNLWYFFIRREMIKFSRKNNIFSTTTSF